jgi:hypothetical protein
MLADVVGQFREFCFIELAARIGLRLVNESDGKCPALRTERRHGGFCVGFEYSRHGRFSSARCFRSVLVRKKQGGMGP